MLLTHPYATLDNYQNTLIHKSELKTHPTLINYAIKEYELIVGTTGTHRYWLPHNPILNLIQHSIKENQLHSKTLCK